MYMGVEKIVMNVDWTVGGSFVLVCARCTVCKEKSKKNSSKCVMRKR